MSNSFSGRKRSMSFRPAGGYKPPSGSINPATPSGEPAPKPQQSTPPPAPENRPPQAEREPRQSNRPIREPDSIEARLAMRPPQPDESGDPAQPSAERGDRGQRGDRPSRGERSGDNRRGGDRGGNRGDRGDRPPRGDRQNRPPQSTPGDEPKPTESAEPGSASDGSTEGATSIQPRRDNRQPRQQRSPRDNREPRGDAPQPETGLDSPAGAPEGGERPAQPQRSGGDNRDGGPRGRRRGGRGRRGGGRGDAPDRSAGNDRPQADRGPRREPAPRASISPDEQRGHTLLDADGEPVGRHGHSDEEEEAIVAAESESLQGQDAPEPSNADKDPDFVPVPVADPKPQSLVEGIRAVAQKLVKKVQKIIAPPEKRTHKEVIINAESLEVRIGVLEDGKLEEFTIERTTEERLVGGIFKGKVRNLEDGLKAAFVDIGFEKNAFLHYWDIVPNNFDSNVEVVERESKDGKKKDKTNFTQKDVPRLFPAGSEIIVQVTKGPIGTKGPRVTGNLVLPGRYLVLLPNSDQSGISRKIENIEERQRLKKILRELEIPENMGVIMRTAGEGQKKRYFEMDLAFLLEEWKAVQERMKTQPMATCIFQEPDLIVRTVRDCLTEDTERIVVDDPKSFERMREVINKIDPPSLSKIKLYTDNQPIFDRFGITKQLETAFSRQVHLKGGGYLVIDETEALVAIDVNTGRHKGAKDQDKTIHQVNLEAAEEICRQLRLRNIGGLIVLDFIDMRQRRDQQSVYQRVKDGMKRDKAKTHILPISTLGLMEMTRQRHTESVRSSVYDDCPYCKGKGKVKSSITMSVEIQRKLSEILKKRTRDESDFQLRIVVHPTVLERLRKEDEKLLIAMEKKYFGKLSFRADPAFHAEQFKIVNVTTNDDLVSVGS